MLLRWFFVAASSWNFQDSTLLLLSVNIVAVARSPVSILKLTSEDLSRNLKYVVPTGRVKVPAGRYVVPTGKDNVIVSAGRAKVIPAGNRLSMTTLADKSLLSGGDNKPLMLEKHLYDSWKSRMELYMMNRPHGRMILASVEKGPLVWPSITVDGVTRLKEYTELTPAEAIQADCDIKAINIILQGLPTEIYALVSQHRVAKDLWEKIKLLKQGTSLTNQERECKLYDEFDKFTYKKGESLHEYYLRFTLLLNDMNICKMPLEQFQVNTKFPNTLPD
ncbi:hypothetical protein Tco_0238439 [Tanacetum coccineum]